MKFAILEIKHALIKILMKYDVSSSANTPKNLEYEEGIIVRRPKDSLPIQFSKRTF